MEQAKAALDKILSNQITSFLFVLSCAIGAVIGIAGGFWGIYKAVIYIGAN